MYDYDKTMQLIDDVLTIVEDTEKKLADDGEISWVEGGALVLAHGLKAVKTISNIKEIGQEIIDTDEAEATLAAEKIAAEFTDSPEAVEAIKQISAGIAGISQGIQKLIVLRNAE